jgi:hypothetical protein
MIKLISATAVAGALAALVTVGAAQAAPASGNMLGKLANVSEKAPAAEQVHWRRKHHYWRWRFYKRHHHHRHHRRWWR